jgi:Pyruvate/2-oxoacid:ferredoxin oxidoreductase gamma subunit
MLDILRKLSLIIEEPGRKKANFNKSEIRVNEEKNSGNSIVTSIFVASILASSAGIVFKASAIHKTSRSSLGSQQTNESK